MITFTNPSSNSGFKAPLLTLVEKPNLKPGMDYDIGYSMGHEESILGIAKKQYAVAAVASDMLQRAVTAGDLTKDQYHLIYETETFPTAAIGYVYNLKPDLAAKVRQAISTFDWKATPLEKELQSSGGTTFYPVNYKNDFSLLRKFDDKTGTKHVIK